MYIKLDKYLIWYVEPEFRELYSQYGEDQIFGVFTFQNYGILDDVRPCWRETTSIVGKSKFGKLSRPARDPPGRYLDVSKMASKHVTGSWNWSLFIWLVVWNMNGLFFHSVGNVIIPTDELSIIFQRGRYTTNQYFPVIIHIFMVFSTINHPYHPFIDDWTRSPSPPHFPLSAPQHGLPGLVWVQHNFGRLLLCHLDILSWWLFVHF